MDAIKSLLESLGLWNIPIWTSIGGAIGWISKRRITKAALDEKLRRLQAARDLTKGFIDEPKSAAELFKLFGRIEAIRWAGDTEKWETAFRNLQNDWITEASELIDAQSLGNVKIISPTPGQQLKKGQVPIRCEISNPPTDGKIAVFSRQGSGWWPHRSNFQRVVGTNNYDVTVHVGAEGKTELHIVAIASPVGMELVKYYNKVVEVNESRKSQTINKLPPVISGIDRKAFLAGLPESWPSIDMGELPTGLVSLASVGVVFEKRR